MSWADVESCLVFLLENPLVERGYEELRKKYEYFGMKEDAEAVGLLIRERFHADRTDSDEGQREDGGKDS